MSYFFYNFPNISYEDGSRYKNIFKRFEISSLLPGYKDIYFTVKVDDNTSLEMLSMQFYETKQYFWVIALANQMTDCLYDFPLHDEEVRELAQKHYDDGLYPTGYSIDHIYQDLKDENDKKRIIKILKPEYINILVKKIGSLNA
jgi:hypothetical protein